MNINFGLIQINIKKKLENKMNIINVSWPKDYSDVIKANLIPGKPLAVNYII